MDASKSYDDQIDMIKERFRGPSGDGTVEWTAIKELMRMTSSLSEAEVEALLRQVDSSHTGRIDFNEFVDFVFGVDKGGGNATCSPSSLGSQQTELPTGAGEMSPTNLSVGKDPDDHWGETFQAEWAEPVKLDLALAHEFMSLDIGDLVQAEYVWLDSGYSCDGKNFDLCSKSLTLEKMPASLADLPVWAYSGEDDTDVQLVPRKIYKDPFRRGGSILVWADTFHPPEPGTSQAYGERTAFNTRVGCAKLMEAADKEGEDPWFGIEQEYYLLDAKTRWPLGWPKNSFPGPQGAYYCSTGASKAPGRQIVEAHYRACLYAGVKLGGVNSEVAPGQWEFQVGPCSGVDAGDDLWMARYILQRVCELFQVDVTFDPKPIKGWAGIGCHTNYSTAPTREPDGLEVIKRHCEKLRVRHTDHVKLYGGGNHRRLTGKDSTMHIDDFSWGVGDRDAAIRIPVRVASQGYGYYEDRRPAANMDPYLVTGLLVETTLFHQGRRAFSRQVSGSFGIELEDPSPQAAKA